MIVREAYAAGENQRLRAWAETIGLNGIEALLLAASKPTRVVPANITFYPLRVDDNMLRKGAEIFNRGLSRRASEELLIEGNILLKNTDMDIRLGPQMRVSAQWRWWERNLLERLGSRVAGLDALFSPHPGAGVWDELLVLTVRRKALRIRDELMHRIYQGVTVNLNHVAASMIMHLAGQGLTEIDRDWFRRAVYLAIKRIQHESSVHLHASLRNPRGYTGILAEGGRPLRQLIALAVAMGLVERIPHGYRLLPKLLERHDIDTVRLRNLVAVYANEVKPVRAVDRCVGRAVVESMSCSERVLASMRFDDARMTYDWHNRCFIGPRYQEINRRETATESGMPFLLLPEHSKALGVILIHGFLASPAEMRPFGERLAAFGYPVMGVRLAGHGTSPWDLHQQGWRDWLESLKQGYDVLSAFAERLCLVGFSAGGTLSLRFAAEPPERLAGVVAVSAPMRFMNRNMRLVPLLYGANRFARRVSPVEGVVPFHPNDPENPHINYRSIPVRGLYELRRLVIEGRESLPAVHCDVAVIQGDGDPVVDPTSAEIIYQELGSLRKSLTMVRSDCHGILYRNIGGTQETILSFLETLESDQAPPRPSSLEPVTAPA
jgi:esterase/lipase